MSADGMIVAFTSTATNLAPSDTDRADIFVRDRRQRTTTRVSGAPGGAQPNGYSVNAAASPEGRFVAFSSVASNLVPGDTNRAGDIFVHNLQLHSVTRVSLTFANRQANGGSDWPTISRGGGVVAFGSFATNLVPGDTNGASDIFARIR
jgi:Tol biopolymer transport system component